MLQYEINSGLAKRLKATPGAWSMQVAETDYTPNPETPYMRGSVIMGDPHSVAFGNGILARQRGIYQVDLYYPQNLNQPKKLDIYAETVRRWFFPAGNRSLTLIEGTTAIWIDRLPTIRMRPAENVFIHRIVEVGFQVDDTPD